MVKPYTFLVLAVLVGACDGEPPRSADAVPVAAPDSVARAEPGPAPKPVASTPTPVRSQAASDPEPPPPLDPAGVLDDEERRLLEADDATLTREQRVARAEAQKKLVMADPEHPLRAVVERIEADVASGAARTRAQEIWSGRAAFPDRDEEPEAPQG